MGFEFLNFSVFHLATSEGSTVQSLFNQLEIVNMT